MSKPTVFVAGATGYTGREVVRLLAESGARTVAHIRPESSKRESASVEFGALGAEVDTTPWDEDAMCATLRELAPDVVFCLVGTTRARQRASSRPREHSYEAVDYGLTDLLVRACQQAEVYPRMVYVSAMGVGPNARSAYMRARWRAERDVVESALPYTVVRPAIISGPDRGESRPGERIAATVGDAALGLLGAIGLKGLRDRYRSMTNTKLAEHLIEVAFDPRANNAIVDPQQLRNPS